MPFPRASLATLLADWLAHRSLAFQYRLGGLLGRLILLSRGMRRRLREQLHLSGYAGRVSPQAVAAHLGRMAIETLALWRTDEHEAVARVIAVEGWDRVLSAQGAGQGLIFLTPHLASFEYAGFWIGAQMPLTVMYRPPREAWADSLMRSGRARLGIRPVPADLAGVRAMLLALRRGEAIGILPDQVPATELGAEGVWAPFYGRPALTMTLVPALAAKTQAAVFMVITRRLPDGVGFELVFEPVHGLGEGHIPLEQRAALLNLAVERAIAHAPEQYLWSYNRYKVPRGAPSLPPDMAASSR